MLPASCGCCGINAVDRFGAYKGWMKKLAAKGWIAPAWPKEYGGAGMTVMQQFVFKSLQLCLNSVQKIFRSISQLHRVVKRTLGPRSWWMPRQRVQRFLKRYRRCGCLPLRWLSCQRSSRAASRSR